jgi:hypothetical protein
MAKPAKQTVTRRFIVKDENDVVIGEVLDYADGSAESTVPVSEYSKPQGQVVHRRFTVEGEHVSTSYTHSSLK